MSQPIHLSILKLAPAAIIGTYVEVTDTHGRTVEGRIEAIGAYGDPPAITVGNTLVTDPARITRYKRA